MTTLFKLFFREQRQSLLLFVINMVGHDHFVIAFNIIDCRLSPSHIVSLVLSGYHILRIADLLNLLKRQKRISTLMIS